MLRNFFSVGSCRAQNQVGGPGQPPGLPMLMTTTVLGVFTENKTWYPLIVPSVKQKVLKAILS